MIKKYEIRKNEESGTVYIYDLKNKKIISEEFDKIYITGLVKGNSKYYLAKKNDREYIYKYDENSNKSVLITENGFNDIYTDGLVKGESSYYIVKENERFYIYKYDEKTDKNTMVADSGSYGIYANGLVMGENDYYYVIGDDKKYNLMDIDNNVICIFNDEESLKVNLFYNKELNKCVMLNLNSEDRKIIGLRKKSIDKIINDINNNKYRYEELVKYFLDIIKNKKIKLWRVKGFERILEINSLRSSLLCKNRNINIKNKKSI